MGDWAYNKLKPLSEETRRLMIRNEFGGINESFYNLYAITGDERIVGWRNISIIRRDRPTERTSG